MERSRYYRMEDRVCNTLAVIGGLAGLGYGIYQFDFVSKALDNHYLAGWTVAFSAFAGAGLSSLAGFIGMSLLEKRVVNQEINTRAEV